MRGLIWQGHCAGASPGQASPGSSWSSICSSGHTSASVYRPSERRRGRRPCDRCLFTSFGILQLDTEGSFLSLEHNPVGSLTTLTYFIISLLKPGPRGLSLFGVPDISSRTCYR